MAPKIPGVWGQSHHIASGVGENPAKPPSRSKEMSFLVLCGHTYGGGEIRVLEKLRVVVVPATYRTPEIQRIIEVI